MRNPDEEITQPVPPETMAEIAAQWEADLKEIASSERPTRNMRPIKKDPK